MERRGGHTHSRSKRDSSADGAPPSKLVMFLVVVTVGLVILAFHPSGPMMNTGNNRRRGAGAGASKEKMSTGSSFVPDQESMALTTLVVNQPTEHQGRKAEPLEIRIARPRLSSTPKGESPPQSSTKIVESPPQAIPAGKVEDGQQKDKRQQTTMTRTLSLLDDTAASGPIDTLSAVGENAVAASDTECSGPRDMIQRYRWNNRTLEWEFPPLESPPQNNNSNSEISPNEVDTPTPTGGGGGGGVRRILTNNDKNANPCGWKTFTPAEVLRSFKNTTILFVGDSMVRNIAMAIMASVCNSRHWQECTQRNHYPFQDPDIWHATNCGNDTLKDDPVNGNWCKDTSRMSITTIPLPGLTSEEFYMTRAERRTWWKKGLVPPLLVAEFIQTGTKILTLEASCVNSKYKKGQDGLDRMFHYLNDANNRKAYPVLNSIDAIVTGGGLHCEMNDFKMKPPWYVRLAAAVKPLTWRSPVIWLEPTNCAKMGGGRSTVTCPYFMRRAQSFLGKFTKAGMIISPANFMTPPMMTNFTFIKPMEPLNPSSWEAKEPCPFVDPLHVCLRCYGHMAQVHYNTILWALKQRRQR